MLHNLEKLKTNRMYFFKNIYILYSTSCRRYSVQARQIRNNMKKLLNNTKSKKKFYSNEQALTAIPENIAKGANEGKRSGNARRSTVLNKLFMKYITDIMATGEYSSQIVGRGIEVSKVKITGDFKILNVYWHTKSYKNDEDDIEKLLQKNAGYLRHELSQLRVIGNVPMIQFVKDKYYSAMAELDRTLQAADFGEDHVPLDYISKLKTELQIITDLDDAMREKLRKFDQKEIENDELLLPPMMQNVLGLNRADILLRLKKAMKKPENCDESNLSWVKFKVNQAVNENPISFDSDYAEREAFSNFLRQRKIMEQKLRQCETTDPDKEYLQEEHWELKNKELIEYTNVDEEIDDYTLEEIDEYEDNK